MKRILFLAAIIIALSSCGRISQEASYQLEATSKNEIKITLYSGGVEVGQWRINGVVNSHTSTDGWYFYTDDGKLVELQGDLIIEYL